MNTDICTQLTRSELFYTACRVAFLRTFDSLLDQHISSRPRLAGRGFLDHVPLLSGTALQVQIDVLLKTWNALHGERSRALTIEEQVVCLSCTHELALAAIADDQAMIRRAARGPVAVDPGDLIWLPSRLRALQIVLPFSPQAAVLQIETRVASEDLDVVRRAGGIDQPAIQRLLDWVGGWKIQSDVIRNSDGLLNATEQEILRAFLCEHPQLLGRTGLI